MKRKLVAGLAAGMMLAGLAGGAQATLLTIGTAGYDSDGNGAVESTENYNLIWDDDNNGNSVVWLDYSNVQNTWQNQVNWAAGLGGSLALDLVAGYTVAWDDTAWRLPNTVDGTYMYDYSGTTTAGYNITNSELGHLFYAELGNQGRYNTDGSENPYPPGFSGFLTSVGDFDKLTAGTYWSDTEYSATPSNAWEFNMFFGAQLTGGKEQYQRYGLSVRSGQVTYDSGEGGDVPAVPEPATILLFGTGLVGLVGLKKRRKRQA